MCSAEPNTARVSATAEQQREQPEFVIVIAIIIVIIIIIIIISENSSGGAAARAAEFGPCFPPPGRAPRLERAANTRPKIYTIF